MKVLSLSQPWASLLFEPALGIKGERAAKQYETRSWKPSKGSMAQIAESGLLIHASSTWRPEQERLLHGAYFNKYFRKKSDLPFGCIIGVVKIKRIVTTEEFLMEMQGTKWNSVERVILEQEKAFGDYSKGRFAWEFSDYMALEKPILAKGKLSLWDFDL